MWTYGDTNLVAFVDKLMRTSNELESIYMIELKDSWSAQGGRKVVGYEAHLFGNLVAE